jgi:ATP-binding cassette subfamily B protein/subfamily B ATP-binding cassette protein MsbA
VGAERAKPHSGVYYAKRVFPYLRPYWKLATLAWVGIVLAGLLALLIPWPLQVVVDNVLGHLPLPHWLQVTAGSFAKSKPALLIFVVLGGLLVTLVNNAVSVINAYLTTTIEQNMVLDFRSDLFQHAQRLSLAFHEQSRAGQLIYAINWQADAAARLVMVIPPLAQSLITLVGMLWIVFKIDPWLSLLAMSVMPMLYLSVGYYVTHIQSRLMKVKEMEGESLSIIHEAVSMLRVIVAFCREGYEYRRFRNQGTQAVKARVKVTIGQTLFSLGVNTITAVGTALVLGFGAYRAMKGSLTPGELLVVLAYIAAVYHPLEQISTTIGSLQDVFITLRVAFDLMDIEPEIQDKPGAIDLPRSSGRVTFEGICFNYKGRENTLRDISFEAQPGAVIGIVGPTGAGKSTLVSLIPRFYGPSHGRILVDGHDVRDLTLKSLREQISIVLQEPLLFSGSIKENIRYGRLEATDAEVMAAARAANAHDFIERLPQGYNTLIGERGARLSGGERQRIAVARAFLKNAPILVLDEPTSSIDSKTEAVILDALDRLMIGRTTFMIAHRLSTLRHTDMVLVLDRGKIVERGTHEQLVRAGGLYRQLYDMQSGAARRTSTSRISASADADDDEVEQGVELPS